MTIDDTALYTFLDVRHSVSYLQLRLAELTRCSRTQL